MTTIKTPAQELADAQAEARAYLESLGERPMTAEETAKADRLVANIKAARHRMEQVAKSDEIRANLARITGGNVARPESGLKARVRRAIEEVGGAKSFIPSGGSLMVGQLLTDERHTGGMRDPEHPQSVLDLIPTFDPTGSTSTVNGAKFAYWRQTARSLNAAPVARGAEKPVSEFDLEKVDGELSVIAHLSQPIDKYALADTDLLVQFIREEMVYGLMRGLEDQVINGDGNFPNLAGLLAVAGTQDQPFDTDLLTTARKAITKLEGYGYNGTAWALNPQDWERFELERDQDDRFMLGGAPVDRAARRLWGLPVATSTLVPVGSGILADWSRIGGLSDGTLEVRFSEVGQDADGTDLFRSNLVVVRCESRFATIVAHPLSIVVVDLWQS